MYLWLFILAGCKSADEPKMEIGAWFQAGDYRSYMLEDTIGPSPLEVEIRALSSTGTPAFGESPEVTVNGAPVEVSLDSHGYGRVELLEPGVSSIVIGGQTVSGHVTNGVWQSPALAPSVVAPSADIRWTAMLDGGLLAASEFGVWWVDGDSVYEVFSPGGWLIRGLRAGHIDEDGVLDALVWTDTQLVLLRGRDGGGVSFGAGLESPNHTLTGADIGDVSGDEYPDVVVSWTGADGAWLVVYEGSGYWEFDQSNPRYLVEASTDLAIGSNTERERLEITVPNQLGSWERFSGFGQGDYLPIGPQLDVILHPQSSVHSEEDLNGDGAAEVVFFGPDEEDADREVYILDMTGETPEYLAISLPITHLDFADITDDGLVDMLMMLRSGNLQAFTHQGETLAQISLGMFPEAAAMATRLHNEDGIPDIFLASSRAWSWHWGSMGAEHWEVGHVESYPLGVNSYLGFLGFEQSPLVEFGRIYAGSNLTTLTRYSFQPGVDSLPSESGWAVLVYEELDYIDGAVCDEVAWVLLDGKLVRTNLQGSAPLVTASLDVEGTRIACGMGPQNSRVALLQEDQVLFYDNALNPRGSEAAVGAYDLVFGTTGGAAVVETCEEVGCEIEAWHPNGESEDSIFVIGGDSLRLSAEELDVDYGVGGSIQLVDVDGDGHEDVLLHQPGGAVGLLRSLSAPLELWTGDTGWLSVPWAADIDGDGSAELWAIDYLNDIHVVMP